MRKDLTKILHIAYFYIIHLLPWRNIPDFGIINLEARRQAYVCLLICIYTTIKQFWVVRFIYLFWKITHTHEYTIHTHTMCIKYFFVCNNFIVTAHIKSIYLGLVE